MLQVNNLTMSFGGRKLLNDISFNIQSGERIGLVGRNGSGKTTLFRLLTGEQHPDEGRIQMPKNYTIGYLKQHLDFTEPTLLAEACRGLRADERDHEWKAEKILSGLGFGVDDFEKPPASFSGGFQVRLNLAKVLLSEPHLLLLDEPTNYMDIVSIRWITRFLRERRNELILITHDRDFMNSITTHSMAIHRGRIKKVEGDTFKLFAQIAVEEEVYEKTRVKDDKIRKNAEDFINRFRAKASKASVVQSRIKALEKMETLDELDTIANLSFRFKAMNFEAQYPMKVNDISFGYTPDRILIENLSIEINKKDRICVIGKNGRGKSTLLRLLAGELQPASGDIYTHPLTHAGYFGQTNIERLIPDNNVVEELARVRPDLTVGEIRNVCGAMMFSGDDAEKKISLLSGGEKSRVSLGKILLYPSNLLLLDEPTNHLDLESCDSMIDALDVFTGAVIIVTHSEMFLHHLANRLIVFHDNGVFVFEGSYQDFLDRVGWDAENVKSIQPKTGSAAAAIKDASPQPSRTKQAQAPARKPNPKTVIAKINRERQAILARTTAMEKHIDKTEVEFETVNLKIAAAAARNASAEIQALQIESHRLQQVIDRRYQDLEILVAELDRLDLALENNSG